METYESLITGIAGILNRTNRHGNKKGVKSQDEILSLISKLKQNYGIEISKKFLFNLFDCNISIKQKRKKLRNLFSGVKTEERYNYKRFFDLMKYKTYVVEYRHNKKPVYSSPCELSEDEKEQIRQIKEVEELSEVALYPRAEEEFKARQHTRDMINRGGGVYIKDIREQRIGKEFINAEIETLHFIKV